MKKIAISSLVSLFLLSCSVPDLNNSPQNNTVFSPFTFHLSPVKEDFSALAKKYNFAELEKEYKSFSTKALADTYVKKMFNKFLIVTPNSVQVIRQVEFSRYLKNNGDTSYETSLKNIFTDTPVLYSSLTGMPAVQSKMTSESGTFGFYILGVSPNQTVPNALPATNITETSFTANWSAVTGATSYTLILDGVEITGITGTSHTRNTLTAGSNHKYSVKAITSGVAGAVSNEINVNTVLAAPVASSATGIAQTSLTANWSAVSGATSYTLVFNGTETTGITGTSHTVNTLTPGTDYSYYVKALNANTSSADSSTINAVTVPANPTANTASSITSTSFTANWSSVTGATGYKLTVDGTETDVANVTSKNITGLTAGTTHNYFVKAYNGSGTGGSSSTVTTVTVPAAPVANTASAIASTSFTANWGTVSGATGYKLFVGGIEVYSGTNTTFNVTGLNSNTIYTYYVRAINQNGTSTNSNTISTTTLSSVIATGLILSLDAGNTGSYPGTGTTWTDLSGNGRNATLFGPVFNSSYSGGIVFDGSNDYVQYNIPYPRSMTVTTIAKSNSTSWNNYAGLGSARRQNGYILHNDAGSTQISFHFLDSSANYSPIGNCVPSNIQQPNFYTISTNGSNIHKIYLNGQLISTNTTSISRTSSPTSQPGILGRDDFENRYNSVTIYYHSIYDRQLSDSEVLQNYNNLKSRFGL